MDADRLDPRREHAPRADGDGDGRNDGIVSFASALSRLQSVAEVGALLLGDHQHWESYEKALACACDKTRASIGLLFVRPNDSSVLALVASRGLRDADDGPPRALSIGDGVSGWVAKNRRSLLVDDIEQDGRFNTESLLGYRRLSTISVPIVFEGALLGVLTLCHPRPEAFSATDRLACEAMATSLSLGLRCWALQDQLTQSYLGAIQALISALEARDPATRGHSTRIAHFCREVGRRLDLTAPRLERLDTAARLHDIGKIGVPDAVLSKPGPLDAGELQLIRRHPSTGAQILRDIAGLDDIAAIVEAHHERIDGTGYPGGLRGEEIPLEARIISAADAFDAMVSRRPYREPLSPEMAKKELRRCVGRQFDERAVAALLETLAAKDVGHFFPERSIGLPAAMASTPNA